MENILRNSDAQAVYMNRAGFANNIIYRKVVRGDDTATTMLTEPLVPWNNTFNKRQLTLSNMAEIGSSEENGRRVPAARMHDRNATGVTKSLDLLRQIFQNSINYDIDQVIRKYLDKFFLHAINNLRTNLGQNSVTKEHVQELCRTMLDEAKHMYLNSPTARSDSPFNGDIPTDQLIGSRFGDRPDDDENMCFSRLPKDHLDDFGDNSAQSVIMAKVLLAPSRRKSIICLASRYNKYDSKRIQSTTKFVTFPRVYKTLGLTNMKNRLFERHPRLFKYKIDHEDKDWLARNRLHIPAQNSSGLTYLFIMDDIKELLHLDYYRNNINVQPEELKGFEVAEFILVKIRATMEMIERRLFPDANHDNDETHSVLGIVGNAVESAPETNEMNQDEVTAMASNNGNSSVIQSTGMLLPMTVSDEPAKQMKVHWSEEEIDKALKLIARGRSQRFVEQQTIFDHALDMLETSGTPWSCGPSLEAMDLTDDLFSEVDTMIDAESNSRILQ